MTTTFNAIVGTSKFNTISVQDWHIWSGLGIALAIYLALYVLRSIGLYVLAKKQGVRKAFLAWIPGVWMFIACKLVGNARFFSQPMQNLALLMCIAFSIAEFLTFAYSFLTYFPLIEYAVIRGETIYIGTSAQAGSSLISYMGTGFFVEKQIYPFGMSARTLYQILDIIYYVSSIFDLASIFITVSVYFALFRKFWPQHYMLASLLSIFFGLFPIFVFVIRNKQPIDYNQYLRARYGAYRNPYGNPYGNPYSGGYGNPYGTQGGASAPKEPESPFEDFEDKKNKKPRDPFEEFDDKKAKNKDPFDEFDN